MLFYYANEYLKAAFTTNGDYGGSRGGKGSRHVAICHTRTCCRFSLETPGSGKTYSDSGLQLNQIQTYSLKNSIETSLLEGRVR